MDFIGASKLWVKGYIQEGFLSFHDAHLPLIDQSLEYDCSEKSHYNAKDNRRCGSSAVELELGKMARTNAS